MKNKKHFLTIIVILGLIPVLFVIWKIIYSDSKPVREFSPVTDTNNAFKSLLPSLEKFYKEASTHSDEVDINKLFAATLEEQTNQLFVVGKPKILSDRDVAIWLLLPNKLSTEKKISIIAYARDIYYYRNKPVRGYIIALIYCQGKFKIHPVMPGDIFHFYPDVDKNTEKASLYYIAERLSEHKRPGYKPTHHIPGQ
jgi:hypothetical protein